LCTQSPLIFVLTVGAFVSLLIVIVLTVYDILPPNMLQLVSRLYTFSKSSES